MRLSGRIFIYVLPFIVFVYSLGIGAYHTNPQEVVSACTTAVYQAFGARDTEHASVISKSVGLRGGSTDASETASMGAQIVIQVRLPRLLAAMLVGAALGCSGAVFQGLFKNPLASPYTLGVSHGAGFGAALAILLGFSQIAIEIHAVIWGLIAVGASACLARCSVARKSATLVLMGVLVGSLFASLVSLTKFVADPTEKLPQITYWLMGSLSGASSSAIISVLPLCIISFVGLFLFRWRMNVLSLGESEALSYGIAVVRERSCIIAFASMLTACSVALAGVIGWVGIVIPHLTRFIVGPDYRKLLPASGALGMSYLMIIDNICRTLSATEIPLGVVTGIIGAPVFAYVLIVKKVEW